MFIIKHLSDYIPQMFEPHLSTFINYFTTTLNNAKDPTSSIVYDTISSMNNIMELSVEAPQVWKLIKTVENF